MAVVGASAIDGLVHAPPPRIEDALPAALVIFADATDRRRLRGELRRSSLELEAADDELSRVREALAAVEMKLAAGGGTEAVGTRVEEVR